MPIKNGRYKDKQGNVRHLETNENMVVVDNGQKTLKQKLGEIPDKPFVQGITGDKTQLQTVDKTNLVNAINELKRTGGGGGATLNVFQRTGGTWGEFRATTATNTFTVSGYNGTTKCIDVRYKGLPLIPNKDFNISSSGAVTLGFQLAVGEVIDYCVSDVSFDFNELANKPNLNVLPQTRYWDSDMNNMDIFPLGSFRIVEYAKGTNQSVFHTPYGDLQTSYVEVTWYNVQTYGGGGRVTQIASAPFAHQRKIWVRYCHDANWTKWQELATTSKINNLSFVNGWKPISASFEALNNVSKSGNTVSINCIAMSGAMTQGTGITTLPEGYRPTTAVVVGGLCYDTSFKPYPCTIVININGQIKVDLGVTNNHRLLFNASFTV